MAVILVEQISLALILGLMASVIIFLAIIFLSGIISSFYGAPYVPMKKKFVKWLLDFGRVLKDDIFYDLGSGDGRVLVSAVREFGVKRAVGYEVSVWPYLESKFLLWQTGMSKDIEVSRQNFFKADLPKATFIYMYLFPKLVDRLAGKIAKECGSGTKILCPSFPIDTAKHPEFKLLKSEKIGKITAYFYQKI